MGRRTAPVESFEASAALLSFEFEEPTADLTERVEKVIVLDILFKELYCCSAGAAAP